MQADDHTGLVEGASICPSPNQDNRPQGQAIDCIIIHAISLPPGEYGGPYIDHLFTNQLDPHAHPYFNAIHGLRVSSHVLIRRDGQITQYVPFHKRAWHAGESSLAGQTQCNDFSIGIELEGSEEAPFTEAQYLSLIALCSCLIRVYPGIQPERVVGHEHVSPGRKRDPGPYFDWARLKSELWPSHAP